ncbi:hypothetical protein NQ318_001839 [Aromia moschata]|uniref:Zinc finger protein n=1 Tax=Aromia moschata TaxID=1265417 RepID=A0AAV8Z3A1_9CUCU|nr:hypothetical protein NQ318_001839 [Aromia moschata]
MKNRVITCRLCCKAVNHDCQEGINAIRTEMLKILMPQLDLGITKNPSICKECNASLEASFQFKSVCLYTEDIITPFMENNDVIDLRDVYRKEKMDMHNALKETQYVCRFCMDPFEKEDCINVNEDKQTVFWQDMAQKCLPELNMKSSMEIFVCKPCLGSLQENFNFVTKCIETEEKIEAYVTSRPSKCTGNVELKDVMQYEGNIKRESNDNEGKGDLRESSSNAKLSNSPRIKMEIEGDEFEERIQSVAYLKTEVEEVELTELFKCDICDYTSKIKEALTDHEKLHIPRKIQLPKQDMGKFKCDECDYSTTKRIWFNNHVEKHSDPNFLKEFRCTLCPFRGSTKLKFVSHLQTHGILEDKCFKCPDCPYASNTLSGLKTHVLMHVKPELVETYKCDMCEFQSKYQRSLNAHKGTHGEATLECYHCATRFKTKSTLIKHLNIHRPREQRKTYKCPDCDYTTISKTLLTRHMDYHKAPEDVQKFLCMHCDFSSIRKEKLKVHMLTHRNKSQLEMHKCPECDYETKWRYNLKKHAMKHKSSSEAATYKCPKCDYRTKYEQALKFHVLDHEGALPIFECAQCDFRTKVKNNLRQHVNRKHKSFEEARKHYCPHCDYVSRDKAGVKVHLATHDDSEEAQKYRCQQCPFKTKHQTSLIAHMEVHTDHFVYTCDFCEVKVRYSSNFRRHLIMCLDRRSGKS